MRSAFVLLSLLILAGCTGNIRPENTPQRQGIVETALAQVGKPYRYAGADPDSGFDCSGLVYYSYAQAGIKVPRNTQAQMTSGELISYEDAQPGDLVFYDFEDKSPNKLHVVMLTGPGLGVHAPGKGREVQTVRLNQPAWSRRYVGTVNLLPDMPALAAAPPAASPVAAPETQPVLETAVPTEPAPQPVDDAITPPRAVEPLPAPQDGDNNWLPK